MRIKIFEYPVVRSPSPGGISPLVVRSGGPGGPIQIIFAHVRIFGPPWAQKYWFGIPKIIFSIVAQVTNTVAPHDCFSAVSSEHVPHTPFRTHCSAHTVSHYINDITIQGGRASCAPLYGWVVWIVADSVCGAVCAGRCVRNVFG